MVTVSVMVSVSVMVMVSVSVIVIVLVMVSVMVMVMVSVMVLINQGVTTSPGALGPYTLLPHPVNHGKEQVCVSRCGPGRSYDPAVLHDLLIG